VANISVLANTAVTHVVAAKSVSISGVVKKNTVGASRKILLLRNNEVIPEQAIFSAGSGNYSFSVTANANDFFTVVVQGLAGEHSQIFNGVTAG